MSIEGVTNLFIVLDIVAIKQLRLHSSRCIDSAFIRRLFSFAIVVPIWTGIEFH